MADLHVACGFCSGPILMATCNHFRGTGHEWVICSVCPNCRAVVWTKEGCLDCEPRPASTEGRGNG